MSHSYAWMLDLLSLLQERFDDQMARSLVLDETARHAAAADLANALVSAGMPVGLLETSAGQNLFLSVLALRVKFPPDEARQKVALNVRMRSEASRC